MSSYIILFGFTVESIKRLKTIWKKSVIFIKHHYHNIAMFHISVKASMVIFLPLVTLQQSTSLRTVFCLDHNLLELMRLRINVSVNGNIFFGTRLTLCYTYKCHQLYPIYSALHGLLKSMIHLTDKHPKSITAWLSVSKNKFYTLIKVWGHSYRGLLYTTSQACQLRTKYIDHMQRERIIKHFRDKNSLKELWMLISKNRC